MKRWEYKHGMLVSVQTSEDLERELNAIGAEGWEVIDVRRKERPIMSRRDRGSVAFKEAYDYDFIFKREVER